jgi:hypothetical protein
VTAPYQEPYVYFECFFSLVECSIYNGTFNILFYWSHRSMINNQIRGGKKPGRNHAMAWGGKSKLAAGASLQLPTPNRILVPQEFVTAERSLGEI